MGAVVAWGAQSAEASFHLMQIEKIIGNVNGDYGAQAIQLRFRAGLQHLVAQSRIRAWDAAGLNPVLIIDITTNLGGGGASTTGARVLISTAAFNSRTSPTAVSDFTMTNPIPPTYLDAGSLTFEDDIGQVYWRVSWGGAAYTGSHTGLTDNDANGNFGPAVDATLDQRCSSLRFTGDADDLSTQNSLQYVAESSGVSVMNYAEVSFSVEDCIPAVSTWGLLAMALVLSSAASVMVARRAKA
jgi:hypothetical protein